MVTSRCPVSLSLKVQISLACIEANLTLLLSFFRFFQLDIDASLLLDSLGDTDIPPSNSDGSELLVRLLQAKSQRDPLDVTDLPSLEIDEWTTDEQLEEARIKAHAEFEEKKKKDDEALSAEYGGKLEETLMSHASFTMSLLERLCGAINEAGTLTEVPEVINAVGEAKALHEERLMLIDRITKLSSENVDLSAELHRMHTIKRKLERDYSRAKVALERGGSSTIMDTAAEVKKEEAGAAQREAAGAGSGGVVPAKSAFGNGGSEISSAEMDTVFAEREKELNRAIVVLEKQLAQSEADKAKTELDLTQRISQPISQQDALVAHLRKTVNDLREQCKQRVMAHQNDSLALREKVSNLELGMKLLESNTATKVKEISSQASEQVAALRAEKEALQSSMYSNKAELSLNSQLKEQVRGFKSVEEAAKAEALKLKERISALLRNQNILKDHISRSYEREEKLEKDLATAKGEDFSAEQKVLPELEAVEVPAPAPAPAPATGQKGAKGKKKGASKGKKGASPPGKESLEPGEEGEVGGEEGKMEVKTPAPAPAPAPEQLPVSTSLSTAQARVHDVQTELKDAHASINDLILEIEAVTAEEVKSREQAARVLRLVSEGQDGQRAICEENLRLQDQLAQLQQKHSTLEDKLQTSQLALRQQEAVITQLVSAEQKARTDLQTQKQTLHEMQGKSREAELGLHQAEQKRTESEKVAEAQVQRNGELHERCKQMQGKLESERKTRMNAQREAKLNKSSKKAASGGEEVAGQEQGGDAGMLNMTLEMLRCSVCRDRFKEVAITRCFHLFCRHCIDTNLANRHRKCPACGEKFGYDDVKTVYFTY